MKLISTVLPDVFIIKPELFNDERGWFMESYNQTKLREFGIDTEFMQCNHSYSEKKGTLRGLHFQNNPMAQAKLVRCTRGITLDVTVDIRKGSPSYKQWIAVELSEENKRQLFIPKGFAHGFFTLTEGVEIQYMVDALYSKEYERSIRFDDPTLGIVWGEEPSVLSAKDLAAPMLDESDANFTY